MQDDWKTALHKSKIPVRMWDGIENWIEHGVHPGHFLRAVFRNDLIDAYSRADDENSKIMREYVLFLYNYAPAGCYGSEHAFRTWEKDKLEARERAERGN